MKKIASMFLALSLLFGMAVSAFGEEGSGSEKTNAERSSIPVYATYKDPPAETTTYYVDVEWSGMNFVYHTASKGKWEPDNLEYENPNATAGWDGEGLITLTNKSAADAYGIYATLEFQSTFSKYGTIGMRYNGTPATSYQVYLAATNATETVKVVPYVSGPLQEFSGQQTLGNITITLTSAVTSPPGPEGPEIFDDPGGISDLPGVTADPSETPDETEPADTDETGIPSVTPVEPVTPPETDPSETDPSETTEPETTEPETNETEPETTESETTEPETTEPETTEQETTEPETTAPEVEPQEPNGQSLDGTGDPIDTGDTVYATDPVDSTGAVEAETFDESMDGGA